MKKSTLFWLCFLITLNSIVNFFVFFYGTRQNMGGIMGEGLIKADLLLIDFFIVVWLLSKIVPIINNLIDNKK